MAKVIHTAVMDAALDKLATCTRQTVVSGASAPANVTAVDAAKLAQKVGLTAGSFTKAAGTVSGRKLTVAAATGVSITTGGSATHVCLDDGTTLLAVTTCTPVTLTALGTVDIPAYVVDEIADVTNP